MQGREIRLCSGVGDLFQSTNHWAQMVRYMVALDGSEGAQKAFDLCLKIAKTNDIVFLITVLQGDNSPKAKEDANNMIINHERVCQEKGVSTNYT